MFKRFLIDSLASLPTATACIFNFSENFDFFNVGRCGRKTKSNAHKRVLTHFRECFKGFKLIRHRYSLDCVEVPYDMLVVPAPMHDDDADEINESASSPSNLPFSDNFNLCLFTPAPAPVNEATANAEGHTFELVYDDEILNEQQRDPFVQLIKTAVERQVAPDYNKFRDITWRVLCRSFKHYKIRDNTLYREYSMVETGMVYQFVAPPSCLLRLMTHIHDKTNHGGVRQCESLAARMFWWPRLSIFLKRYIRSCKQCAAAKSAQRTPHAELTLIARPVKPFQIIHFDLMGPFTISPSGHLYILVMIDYFSGYVIVKALKDKRTETIARMLYKKVIMNFGVPEYFHSDNALEFVSKLILELCHLVGAKKSRSTVYHPQGNGSVERANRTLKAALRILAEKQADWPSLLPEIVFHHRAAINVARGFSPFFLVHGQDPVYPLMRELRVMHPGVKQSDYVSEIIDRKKRALQFLNAHMPEVQMNQKFYHDRELDKHQPLAVGSEVYVREYYIKPGMGKSLHLPYAGPFIVKKFHPPVNYTIGKAGTDEFNQRLHFNLLKPTQTYLRENDAWLKLPETSQTEDESVVDVDLGDGSEAFSFNKVELSNSMATRLSQNSDADLNSRSTEIDDIEDAIYLSGDEDEPEVMPLPTTTRSGRVTKPVDRLVHTYFLPPFGIF